MNRSPLMEPSSPGRSASPADSDPLRTGRAAEGGGELGTGRPGALGVLGPGGGALPEVFDQAAVVVPCSAAGWASRSRAAVLTS